MGLNHYTELLRYVKSISDTDPFVNTTTQGITEDIDLDKANIFPILNVEVFDGGFPTNGVSFTLELTCLDIRDNNKEINTDKFWLQDNKVDNFNTTFAVLNRMVGKMKRDFEDRDIEIEIPDSVGKLEEWGKNTLDGWVLSTTVTMPNKTINLCS